MMMLVELIWIGAVAGGVAAAAMLAARCCAVAPRGQWALAVAMGYVAGHLIVTRGGGTWPAAISLLLQPREARDWLPMAVLAAAGLTVVSALASRAAGTVAQRGSGPDRAPRWHWFFVALAALLAFAAPARLLAGSVYTLQEWSSAAKFLYLAILGTAFGVVWSLLAAARDDEQPRLRAALLTVVAVLTAATLSLAGTLVYGQLCTAVAGAIVGATVCHWLCQCLSERKGVAQRNPLPVSSDRPATALAEPVAHSGVSSTGLSGAAGVLTMSLGSLIMLGHFYAELTRWNAVLLILALITAGGPLPRVNWLQPFGQAMFRIAVSLVPAVLALVSTYAAVRAGAASPY